MRRLSTGCAVLLLAAAACTGAPSSTPTLSPTSATVSSTTTLVAPVTTSTGAGTSTTAVSPDRPLVSTGWELQPGDLIVADQPGDLRAANNGVTIMRDGAPIYQPVSTPVNGAVAVGSTQLVVAFAGSLWLVSSNGAAFELYGHVDRVLDVVDLPAFGAGGWVAFVEWGLRPDGEFYQQFFGLVSLSTGAVIVIPSQIGEGGVTGIAGLQDSVMISASTDGPAFFEAWDRAGVEVVLPHNPAPRDTDDWSTRRTRLVSAGSDLVAFIEDADQLVDAEEYLVLLDPVTGVEVVRTAIPGSAVAGTRVWGLDADGERIVVTTGNYSVAEGHFDYMLHEFDRSTGTWDASFPVVAPVRLAKWFGG